MADFKLTDEQLAELAVPEGANFHLAGVKEFSTPHPYCIGPRHVGHASDHFSGMLGTAAIESAEKKGIHCAMKGCNLGYKEHEHHKALMVVVPDNSGKALNANKQLRDWLVSVKEKAESFGVTTFMFPQE